MIETTLSTGERVILHPASKRTQRKLWVFTHRPSYGGHYRWIAENLDGTYVVGKPGTGDGGETFGPFDGFDVALTTLVLTDPRHE
jgi:hypothetical protein